MTGSSPLARGLQQYSERMVDGSGIIPARAGFTHRVLARPRRRGDHPRSRGVYGEHVWSKQREAGSSPLARGLRRYIALDRLGGRIIPARAGFTPYEPASPSGRQDHPRSRGVYFPSQAHRPPRSGSSPLARGLRAGRRPCGPSGRIIPARAGFTRTRRFPGAEAEDHPRSRGVYGLSDIQSITAQGSSPLARGLPRGGGGRGVGVGIIPARAGFTRRRTRRIAESGDHPRSRGVY